MSAETQPAASQRTTPVRTIFAALMLGMFLAALDQTIAVLAFDVSQQPTRRRLPGT